MEICEFFIFMYTFASVPWFFLDVYLEQMMSSSVDLIFLLKEYWKTIWSVLLRPVWFYQPFLIYSFVPIWFRRQLVWWCKMDKWKIQNQLKKYFNDDILRPVFNYVSSHQEIYSKDSSHTEPILISIKLFKMFWRAIYHYR